MQTEEARTTSNINKVNDINSDFANAGSQDGDRDVNDSPDAEKTREIGIGVNARLGTRPAADILAGEKAEKYRGSYHIALGASYDEAVPEDCSARDLPTPPPPKPR